MTLRAGLIAMLLLSNFDRHLGAARSVRVARACVQVLCLAAAVGCHAQRSGTLAQTRERDAGSVDHDAAAARRGRATDTQVEQRTDASSDAHGFASDGAAEASTDASVDDASVDTPRAVLELTRYVNPFIGTAESNSPNPVLRGSGGAVFPGATVPFGMLQWSPDTPNASPSGYAYADGSITGFSTTHYSGAGCPNGQDLAFMPLLSSTLAPASFDHANEHASPGHYEVAFDNGVRVGLTATLRSGMATITFPHASEQWLSVDASRNAASSTAASAITQLDSTAISGFTTGGAFCGNTNRYQLYFFVQFDRPVVETVSTSGSVRVRFDDAKGTDLRVKVGLSYVSVGHAQRNLGSENPGWDFGSVREGARTVWNARLNAIQVAGGDTLNLTKFYTALYHSLLFPSTFSDVGGEYLGFDGLVHSVLPGRTQYANYSGWDIYRSQVQLLALLFPAEASDMAQSLIDDAAQCGALPRWSQNNTETGVMVGDPGALIVSNLYAFGARAFAQQDALALIARTSADANASCNGVNTFSSLSAYLSLGYVPDGQGWGPVSATLEYTGRDFAVSRFADALGDRRLARVHRARAGYWQNALDLSQRYVTARSDAGAYYSVAGAGDQHGYVEGNAEQYTWMVPYDVKSLIDGLGGDDAVTARLDSFFEQLNAGLSSPHFYMGNEPNFATPWLYNWTGAAWRTQDVVRRILDESFTAAPGGLPGNDDLGAMSSWFVFAALGMYPSIPAIAGFALNAPLFASVKLYVAGKEPVLIESTGSPGRYIEAVSLNGSTHRSSWLSLAELVGGGTVHFSLQSAPSLWAHAAADRPPSFGVGTFTQLSDAMNERGIGDQGQVTATNFDGLGAYYSRSALANASLYAGASVTHAGVQFVWPSGDDFDNTVAVGQVLAFEPPLPVSKLAILGAASNGPTQGVCVLSYADGTTATVSLRLSDWTLNGGALQPAAGNYPVATTSERFDARGNAEPVSTFVFYTELAVDSTRTLVSVKLPARVDHGKLHVFAITRVP